jgi:hypothetical protein
MPGYIYITYEGKNRHCVLCTSKYSEGSEKGREGKREGGRTRVLCTSKYSEGSDKGREGKREGGRTRTDLSEGSEKGREGKREGGRTRTDLVALLLLRVPHTGLIALLVPGMHSDEEGGRRIRGGRGVEREK